MIRIFLLSLLLTTGSLAQRVKEQPASSGEEKRLLALPSQGKIVPCKWTNWIDRDNPSMNGDYEFDPALKGRCNVEKYEVSLVSGGPVYTSVASIPTNQVSYNPASAYAQGPYVYCVNKDQPGCKVNSNGDRVGPSPPCCMDYKARFCCKKKITVETCKWTNWIDRDNESGKGDYEFDPALKKRCNVEKYEVSLVSGGPVYTSVASIPTNQVSYNPASSEGPQVYCVNKEQKGCKVNSNGWKAGPSPPCCMDYKARFCCKNKITTLPFTLTKG